MALEWIGLGGFILGIIDLVLIILKYRKDGPIVKITKKAYKKEKMFSNIEDNHKYTKLIEKNLERVSKNEIRELILEIQNKGNRPARLKNVRAVYHTPKTKNYPKMPLNFFSTEIKNRDKEELKLFFEFPIKDIDKLEEEETNKITIYFDFAHKKIKKKFLLNKPKILPQ